MPFWGREVLVPLSVLICAVASTRAGEFHGRVVDRGTLEADGKAKGIAGVQITVYDGKRQASTAVTNTKGQYRIRKAPARCRVVYRLKGAQPAVITRHYSVSPSDTGSFDVAFDRPPRDNQDDQAMAYWQGVAKALFAMPLLESFFRDAPDSGFTLGAAFVARDSSADYRAAVAELLWEEFLSQDRPLLARYHLAHALKPILDSLAWEPPKSMGPFLETDPMALEALIEDLQAALKDPKKLPSPKEIRKAGIAAPVAAGLATRLYHAASLPKRKRDLFKARWKKLWGKELPETAEEEPQAFQPALAARRMAEARPGSAVAQLLYGRALFAAKDYSAAAEALAAANKLRPGVFPAARYLEAMAYLQLGRDYEALGRFQALREAPDPAWKSKAYYGLAVINEKEKRHAEAAADLWRSIRQRETPEAVFLLAEVGANLNDNSEIEKLLAAMVAKHPGEHRAHYWLGRYAERREQSGVAEDHFRKAWQASPSPQYAEALGRLSASREEWVSVLQILEPIKARLGPDARELYADALLHLGRSREAAREFSAAYLARPTPALLGRHVEALLQSGKVEEAQAAVAAFKDQEHSAAKLAQAKVSLRAGDIAKSRLLLEDLAKREETNPELHYLLGLGHYQEQAFGKARKEFDLALRYRADHLDAVYYAGLTLVKLGRPEDARNFFNELAQRAAPEWKAKGFIGVGLSFASQQKPEAAENYYQRSLSALETAEALALLALSQRRLGGPEVWAAGARRAFELDNRHPKAVQAMGEVYFTENMKSQALKLFQRANAQNPSSCEILAGLAKSQYLMGQYQAGRVTSASAISQCPGEADPYYYAAVTSDKLRNRKEAEDYFRAYRKAGGDEGLLPEEYR